ncbi:MAG: hypothetical protein RL557_957 [archaeon]|jgi:hypothetical protein
MIMEKSPLEQKLESTLQELGIPLGPRIGQDELELDIEFEDLTTEVKSTDDPYSKFRAIMDEEISEDQLTSHILPIRRQSNIDKGLGFEYESHRRDTETIGIYYEPKIDQQLKIKDKRYHLGIINQLYGNTANQLFFLGIGSNILTVNYEYDYALTQGMRDSLGKLESLEKKPFSEQTANELMQYIQELYRATPATS